MVVMRAVEAGGFGLGALHLVERPAPRPGPGEIVVDVRAATLNYRDLAILEGSYKPDLKPPLVPGSDASGEVIEVGPGVTRFKVGDRVVPTYTQGWIDGLPTPEQRVGRTLGVPLSGVLQDYIAVPAEDAVTPPAHLTDVEAATLPIAALPAWSTLQEGGVKPGDWVLVEGTGGAALFALQFAKLAGAWVLVLSSSEEKLARARDLGADATINYREAPGRRGQGGRWEGRRRHCGRDRGQHAGSGALGGFVGVIGFLGGYQAVVDIRQLIGPMVRTSRASRSARARGSKR